MPQETKTKREPTTDAVEILHRRYFEGHPERLSELEEIRVNDAIGCKAYELREQAGLTESELGERVGTAGEVITRLEEGDYDGQALVMLNRIAAALGKRVEITLVPAA